MPENNKLPITDEMIRAAVHRELDSIDIPPVESAWQRLEARRAAGSAPSAPARRGRSWARYSALAAALLLFFFGGYGVYRTLNINDQNRALLLGSPESDNNETLTSGVDKEESGTYSLFDYGGWNPVEVPRGAQQRPPDALDGYVLEATFTRKAESGVEYLAGLYTRDEASLLWVQSDVRSADQFVTDLEQLLQVPVEPHTLDDTLPRLAINGRPALIWEKNGRRYLLWEITGFGTEAELNRLVPED